MTQYIIIYRLEGSSHCKVKVLLSLERLYDEYDRIEEKVKPEDIYEGKYSGVEYTLDTALTTPRKLDRKLGGKSVWIDNLFLCFNHHGVLCAIFSSHGKYFRTTTKNTFTATDPKDEYRYLSISNRYGGIDIKYVIDDKWTYDEFVHYPPLSCD